jgi:hypothetical protein
MVKSANRQRLCVDKIPCSITNKRSREKNNGGREAGTRSAEEELKWL